MYLYILTHSPCLLQIPTYHIKLQTIKRSAFTWPFICPVTLLSLCWSFYSFQIIIHLFTLCFLCRTSRKRKLGSPCQIKQPLRANMMTSLMTTINSCNWNFIGSILWGLMQGIFIIIIIIIVLLFYTLRDLKNNSRCLGFYFYKDIFVYATYSVF